MIKSKRRNMVNGECNMYHSWIQSFTSARMHEVFLFQLNSILDSETWLWAPSATPHPPQKNLQILFNFKKWFFTHQLEMRLLYFPVNIFFNQDWSGIVRGRNNLATVKQRKPARLIPIHSVHTSTLLYFENLYKKLMTASIWQPPIRTKSIFHPSLTVNWHLAKCFAFPHSFIHSLIYNFFNTCTLSPWMSSSIYKFTLSTFRLARNLNVTKCLHSFIPSFISSYIKFASVPFRAREISLGCVQPLEIMKSDEIIIGTTCRLTKAFIINLSCIRY